MKKILFVTPLVIAFLAYCSSCSDKNETPEPSRGTPLETPSPQLFTGSLTPTGFTAVWEAVPNAAAYLCTLDSGAEVRTADAFVSYSGLEPGTRHTLQVRALPADGAPFSESNWALLIVSTPSEPPLVTALETPSPTLLEGSLTAHTFTVVWESVPGAGTYEWTLGAGAATQTAEPRIDCSGLTPQTSYSLRVRALPLDTEAHSESEWADLTVTTAAEAPDPVIPTEYTLVWSDEFDGDELDLSKWFIEDNGNGGGNNELQYYDARGVSMGTEPVTGRKCLILTARKENYRGRTASSGRINTSNSFTFTHGRVEALIRLPQTADGLWPAFWLLGADYIDNPWPACGEIDILEMGNATGIRQGTQDRYFNGACHWGHYSGSGYPNYAVASNAPYSLQDGFHLFTLEWDEQAVRCYLDLHLYPDNEPYFAMNIDDKSEENSPGHYFHKDYFILFNLAVGGNFTGIWNIDQITALASGQASMYVDYVRVYQK